MDFALTPPEPKETRFTPFKQLIFAIFEQTYKREPRWGPMESNHLANLLKEMPSLTGEQLQRALLNIMASGDIPKGQRPGAWLHKIDSYIEENHNIFGRNPCDAVPQWQTTEASFKWRPN